MRRAPAPRTTVSIPPDSRLRRRVGVFVVSLLAAACTPERAAPPRPGTLPIDRVLSVADGDSFTVQTTEGTRVGIRIAGIDAPERQQPHADAARASLQSLLARGDLLIEPTKTDPFGRRVARVRASGEDVGLAQVRAGLAWHFVRYQAEQPAAEREAYARAQREARDARRGLWADPDPVPPWVHRQANPAAPTGARGSRDSGRESTR